ncbi:putative transmembrane protein [Candidatus Burkholderia verschuerenii]|uniref:Putative transmembrane protein n=1 Tax=Candidatus Burkholderia verschuerenii TaxID=242163 RepID=A0A0L0M5P5_9BURK|nr:RDD family protein [Candidatus Burkholderia verschuerenii]KND57595.1 putative transmembrane protein [Candidatus Burkholderia verschuerenii]
MSASASVIDSPLRAPTLRRRLAAMLYEAVILFGVIFLAAYLFSTLTQQRNGLMLHNWLMAWVGIVLAAYFVWFWCHGGQTLPMKTWRLKLVDTHGQPVKPPRAFVRYLLAWLWFLPPLALHPILGLAVPQTLLVLPAWVILWALAVRFDPARQFIHDRLAGTRIVMVRSVAEKAAAK